MSRINASRKLPGAAMAGHIAALVTVFMWGYSFVSTKVLMDNGMGPVQVYMSRFLIAYLLVLFVSHKKLWASNWREEGLFCLCGILSGSVYFIAENTALKYTFTTNVSLLTSLSPLITVILVGFIYKTEKIGKGTWLGSAIAVLGVFCVVFNSATAVEVRPLGDFLALSAAVCWAVYSMILRSLNAHYDVWFITRKTFFYGLLTAVPFLIFEDDKTSLFEIIGRPEVFGNLLFLGLGASFIAFVLWAQTIKMLGAVKANNYMYLQTVVTLVVSAIVLGEHVSWLGYIGIALILGGLWVGDNVNKILARRQRA